MPASRSVHVLSLAPYTADAIVDIVRERPALRVDDTVADRIARGAAVVAAKAASDEHVYGVNTGVGALCETRVPADALRDLQRNIVLSHACGVGPWASEEICRAALLLKLLTFRFGASGVRLGTVTRMIDLWNAGIVPVAPMKGSLGASGDLAPLAHMALPLLGLGTVSRDGALVAAGDALAAAGIDPIELAPKEGLSLINGVQFSTAMGLVALRRARELRAAASVVASISAQAFSTASTFYDPRYHRLSAHAGQRAVAAELAWLMDGSNHARLPTCNRSQQDPYSFRCVPQVHGACRDAVAYAADALEAEANSAGDNPLIVGHDTATLADDDPATLVGEDTGTVLYGGNLHGEPCALAMDLLAMAVTELSSISERRSFQLLAGERGLPPFLAADPGRHSGYMIAQYTAAALLNENRVLATPASVDNATTSRFQEDHVSMSATAGSKLLTVVDNATQVLAIELLLAVQAAEMNRGLDLSPYTGDVAASLRAVVAPLAADRLVHDDLVAACELLSAHMPRWRRDVEALTTA